MKNIIDDILDQFKNEPLAPNEKVKKIVLKVGALDIHSEESFAQAFTMLIKDSVLENCALHLEIERGTLECPHCDFQGPCPQEEGDGHDALPVTECPACKAAIPISGGRGIQTIDLITESS